MAQPWEQSRIFARMFTMSGGLISNAMELWMGMICVINDNSIEVRIKPSFDLKVFENLTAIEEEVLLQCLIHKTLDKAKLARVSMMQPDTAFKILSGLGDCRILQRDEHDHFKVNPILLHNLMLHFRNRFAI